MHCILPLPAATVDPRLVVERMEQGAKNEGVEFHYGCHYVAYKNKKLTTTLDNYESGHTVNAAGLYADKIARDFGFPRITEFFLLKACIYILASLTVL